MARITALKILYSVRTCFRACVRVHARMRACLRAIRVQKDNPVPHTSHRAGVGNPLSRQGVSTGIIHSIFT